MANWVESRCKLLCVKDQRLRPRRVNFNTDGFRGKKKKEKPWLINLCSPCCRSDSSSGYIMVMWWYVEVICLLSFVPWVINRPWRRRKSRYYLALCFQPPPKRRIFCSVQKLKLYGNLNAMKKMYKTMKKNRVKTSEWPLWRYNVCFSYFWIVERTSGFPHFREGY